MPKRAFFALITLALAPAVAAAQFTTFIPPSTRTQDSIKKVVAATQRANEDSVTRAQIADMKTWVDSAAGVMVPAAPVTDSLGIVPRDTAFADGAVAPNTATPLPLLLAMGGALLGLGVVLLRRDRPKLARVKPRRRA